METKEGEEIPNLQDMKPGDHISYRGPTTSGHTVVVVRKIYMRNDDGSVGFRGVQIAEGNYGGKWNWGRQISQADVEDGTIEIYIYANTKYKSE